MEFFSKLFINRHCEKVARPTRQSTFLQNNWIASHTLAMTRKTESGNILVYILGAVFLLGILTIAVKGSNTPGAGIDQETLMIRVSEIQNYGSELERAVAYVLANGHSEADIRFAHPNASSAYGDITDTPTRQVFSRQGGGATYREPENGIQTTVTPWFFSGNNTTARTGTTCTLDRCTDLTALLLNVSKEFCVLVNDKNSITNPADDPAADIGSVEIATPFTGGFVYSQDIANNVTEFDGHMEGCFEGGGTPPAGTYHYYRVLLAR